MKNMNTFICHSVFNLLLIFVLLRTASCLNCYECFSSASGNCAQDFVPNKVAIKPCNLSDTICYKESKTFKGIPVVLRDCGTPETCNNITRNCFLCDTDLCNGLSTTVPSIAMSLFLLNVNKIFNYFTY